MNTSGCLKAEERNILSELGRNIGKSNTEGETAVLALAQTRLESVLESASEEKKAQRQALPHTRDNAGSSGRHNADIESGGVI